MESEEEEGFQTPVSRGGGGGKQVRTPPMSSIRRRTPLVRKYGPARRVVKLRDPSDTPPPPPPHPSSSSSPTVVAVAEKGKEDEGEDESFAFDASMNLEHLDPSNPADAMLLDIEALLKTPTKGPLQPKSLFASELFEDNWNVDVENVEAIETDLNHTIHDSFSMEVISDISVGEGEHDEEVQHVLDMQLSREYAEGVSGYFDGSSSEDEVIFTVRRPVLGMRRDGQFQPHPQEQQQHHHHQQPQEPQAAAAAARPTFEIYVPNDSVDELSVNTSMSVLDDGRRTRIIRLKGVTPLRVRVNPSIKTRAAVTRFALKIISIAEQENTSVGIRTWTPRIHDDSRNSDRGVTFTFEHFGSTYGRRFASLMGLTDQVRQRRQRAHPFHPPVGLFTLRASMFPSEERFKRDAGDGMPGVNSIFLMPPGSFVTVLSPLDSRFLKSVDHVVLEINYVTHGKSETLMRLAVHKAVFAGLLFYDQRTVVMPRVPVTESMEVDIKLHVRVRQKTKRGDQVMIVAVEKAEFTVPYGFEGILREKIVAPDTSTITPK